VPTARRLREEDREENNVVDVRGGEGNGSGYYRGDQPIHVGETIEARVLRRCFSEHDRATPARFAVLDGVLLVRAIAGFTKQRRG
jgi:hypothetical protein